MNVEHIEEGGGTKVIIDGKFVGWKCHKCFESDCYLEGNYGVCKGIKHYLATYANFTDSDADKVDMLVDKINMAGGSILGDIYTRAGDEADVGFAIPECKIRSLNGPATKGWKIRKFGR